MERYRFSEFNTDVSHAEISADDSQHSPSSAIMIPFTATRTATVGADGLPSLVVVVFVTSLFASGVEVTEENELTQCSMQSNQMQRNKYTIKSFHIEDTQ